MSHRYADAIESKLDTLHATRRWLDLIPPTLDADNFTPSLWFMADDVLPSCDSFYMDAQIASALVESSAGLPPDTSIAFGGLPLSGWLWFSEPLPVGSLHETKQICALSWGVIEDPTGETTGPALVISGYTLAPEIGAGPLTALCESVGVFRPGFVVELDGPGAHVRPATKSVIKFFVSVGLWVEQRIVSDHAERTDRPTRRRLERAGFRNTDVRVVRLRRADYTHGPAGATEREYSCQWIVRGHWRQQFYPSTNENRPRWIMPYVKGPEDAPLKTPAPTVFAVTR